MPASAVGHDKLFAHPDILNQRNMGRTDIGATTAFDTGGDVSRRGFQPFFAFDCFYNHRRFQKHRTDIDAAAAAYTVLLSMYKG